MTATYEAEQNGLQQTAQRLKDEISAVREEGESVNRFMKLVNNRHHGTERRNHKNVCRENNRL